MNIGVLGGTFDPLHNGHMQMAEICLESFEIDKVMFLPLGDAPHKPNVTKAKIRFEMLENALKNETKFFVSDMEIKRSGKTYTFDTLTELNKEKDNFYYIIGGDTLNTLDTWYRADDVFKMTEFLVVLRPECDFSAALSRLKDKGAVLHFSKKYGQNISSSEIRDMVKNNEDISGLVPHGVKKIIDKYGLYKN